MNRTWNRRTLKIGLRIPIFGLAFAMVGVAAGQDLPLARGKEVVSMKAEEKFYCNIRALTSAERVRHRELTKKLLASRSETVETEKGYEFHYSPNKVSISEVGEWVVLESRCCSFFDFHIDLEERGKLICLRLTGKEGVKAFIRAEFSI